MTTSKPRMMTQGLLRDHRLQPAQLVARRTPADDVFLLAHMGVPEVTREAWSLTIDGLVGRPLVLSFDDLLGRSKRSLETIHQCAGSPTDPTRPVRQIANVRWAGADLRALLAEAGVSAGAAYLWATGLDHGEVAGERQDCYLKDLPLSRVAAGDVLIAYELNGAPLSAERGFPARLVVPGYYGTNSVKWLSRLRLANVRASGLFTTKYYNDPVHASDLGAGSAATKPVWEIAPESVIVAPAPDRDLPRGEIEIWGWAWADGEIESVVVSTDGGARWQAADLEPRAQRSWQRFTYAWQARAPGSYDLLCRATDGRGQTQPLEGARNAVYARRVTVVA